MPSAIEQHPLRLNELDDYTDPWKPASAIILQHGYARSGRFWRVCVPQFSRYTPPETNETKQALHRNLAETSAN
jgi:hypothetical protein